MAGTEDTQYEKRRQDEAAEYDEWRENGGQRIDWPFWIALPAWTDVQAAALLCGVDPRRLSRCWPALERNDDDTLITPDGGAPADFALRDVSAARRDQIEQALIRMRAEEGSESSAEEARKPARPYEWVHWAEQRGIPVWPRLLQALDPQGTREGPKVSKAEIIKAFAVKPIPHENEAWWDARLGDPVKYHIEHLRAAKGNRAGATSLWYLQPLATWLMTPVRGRNVPHMSSARVAKAIRARFPQHDDLADLIEDGQ